MRAIVAKAIFPIGLVVGLVAATSWAYFIWGFDWGTSYRSHGLWAVVFFLGAMVAFLAGLYGVGIVGSYIFPNGFSDKS